MSFKDLRNLCTQILTFCSCFSDGFSKTEPCHFASTTKLTEQQKQCHLQDKSNKTNTKSEGHGLPVSWQFFRRTPQTHEGLHDFNL